MVAVAAQNNQWAFSHPNALRSATSPRVLHICENGADVLVLEMCAGHLQVVAGQLEKLVERLADENAQGENRLLERRSLCNVENLSCGSLANGSCLCGCRYGVYELLPAVALVLH